MSSKITDFVVDYYRYALKSEKETKIPATFTLAQAALESGWGAKAMGNNLFGITANKNWDGATVLAHTFEYHDTDSVKYPHIESITYLPDKGKYKYIVERYFRAYEDISDCFNDHNEFLKKKRYAKAFNYLDDPKQFAVEVAKAGYATALNYAKTLHSVIDRIQDVIDELGLASGKVKLSKISASVLNVRSGPSTSFAVVRQLGKNDDVMVFEQKGDWSSIKLGITGWVANRYLSDENLVAAGSLNVREAPGKTKIGNVTRDTKVIVLEEEGLWSKISTEEWVHSNYVKEEKI